MIIFCLGLLKEVLLPPRRKMDRIDHACMWIINICLVILFFTLPMAVDGDETMPNPKEDAASAIVDPSYFFACSGGKLDDVQSALEEHPCTYFC